MSHLTTPEPEKGVPNYVVSAEMIRKSRHDDGHLSTDPTCEVIAAVNRDSNASSALAKMTQKLPRATLMIAYGWSAPTN